MNEEQIAPSYEEVLESIFEATEGDSGKLLAFCNRLSYIARSGLSTDESRQRRYIKAKELNHILSEILDGVEYDDAAINVAKELAIDIENLRLACDSRHNPVVLNRTYRMAESDIEGYKKRVKERLDKLVSDGLLERSDFKGKVKPKSGLTRIAKAVKHKKKHDEIENTLKTLTDSLNSTKTNELLTNIRLDSVDNLSMSVKIEILLKEGKTSKEIQDALGCSKQQVSNVKRKMEE